MAMHAASYFAGVGTVIATMTLGFGGGVLLTDAFVGKSERTPTLMERRASPPESSPPVVAATSSAQTSEQQATAQVPAEPAHAPQPQMPEQATVQQSAAAQPVAPAQATTPRLVSVPQQVPAPVQASTAAPAPAEQARLEQSMGRTQDANLISRDAETKKAAAERRKYERRKWAERRKREMQKIEELTAMSEKVRDAEREREREPVFRSFAAESPTFRQSLTIRMFGDSDD